jgi:hypothetical protein
MRHSATSRKSEKLTQLSSSSSSSWWSKIAFKNRLATILKINEALFPHLYVIASVLLAIELVTYRGFTFKYLFLDARLLLAISLFSFLIIFVQNLHQQIVYSDLTKLILQLNKLAIIPLLLVNYLLISLDLYYYPNYVYSHFHINSSNLQLILSFNVFILLLQLLQKSPIVAKFIWQRFNFRSTINILFLLAVVKFALPDIQLVSSWMYEAGIRVIRTMDLSWEERFVFLNGGEKSTGWITYYTNFINKHVAERGVIFIPPQKEAWQMEGNPYYMRWFIYPRYTVQSQDIEAPIPAEAEYILIDNGAWPGMEEYGWPRMFIPAAQIEKMVFIDRDTREETVVIGQDYDPATMSYKWGVIQLKR